MPFGLFLGWKKVLSTIRAFLQPDLLSPYGTQTKAKPKPFSKAFLSTPEPVTMLLQEALQIDPDRPQTVAWIHILECYLASLCLGFLICNTGIIMVYSS